MRAEEKAITESNAKQAWELIKPLLPGIARWYIKAFPHTKLAKIIQVLFTVLVKNDTDLQEYRALNP
ncbi:MAG: hypothetical protein K0S09_4 [Sphingobacteriaceae bacterium]|jgi:hypothetical protein|nr:hypothetical protein [Sphingobacteriaceae bacterium]